jgi:NAD(P)-dependent dehydrogenase (short-subunit alcohol dehydrogenase family)
MLYDTSPDALFLPAHTIDPLGFGKVAVVTGCSSGIGLACAQLLLAHQFSVFGVDQRAFDYALVREADHGRFHFRRADLVEEGACEGAVLGCISSFGRIDLLVNVAGLMDNFASADAVTDELWNAVLAVNLTVPVRMMREVLPHMRDRGEGGVIINVASTAGVSGAVAGIAYTSSKHGLIGATKNVAWRFRNDGIRCNAVLPGAIDSSIGKAIADGQAQLNGSSRQAGQQEGHPWDAEAFAQVEPVHALQARPSASAPTITALEVAKTIVFLASDQARTVNGVSLPVDKAWGVV